MSLTAMLAALVVISCALCGPGNAQVQRNSGQVSRPGVPSESVLRERINRWTVGLAGGLLDLAVPPSLLAPADEVIE